MKRDKKNIDTDSLIISLTDGIGVHLGKHARSSFYELYPRLSKVPQYNRTNLPMQQLIVDLLAVAVVYNEVISPLESGQHFSELTRNAGATHIRIGKDKLTGKFAARMRYCVADFHSMLKAQDVPVELLTFSSMKEFVNQIIIKARENSRATVDRQSKTNDPGKRVR